MHLLLKQNYNTDGFHVCPSLIRNHLFLWIHLPASQGVSESSEGCHNERFSSSLSTTETGSHHRADNTVCRFKRDY